MKNYKKIIATLAVTGLIFFGGSKALAVHFYDTLGTRYEGAAERLAELKIVSGVSKNVFEPERKVTRAEFAKMLVESSLKPAEIEALISDDKEVNFKDVSKDEWYYKYVVAAVNNGYMKGYEDGSFRPNDSVTYAEISKMVTLALGHRYLRSDDPRGWQAEYVDKMYEIGCFKNIYIRDIHDPAIRGNVANILWNMLRTTTWKMIERNETDGFAYVDSHQTLFSHKIIDHVLLTDVKILGYTEINGNLYVEVSNGTYKLFDQDTIINFSSIGGRTDLLLKRVEYPGEIVQYEAIGVSTDIGSTLYSGTYNELKEQGFDLSNKYKLSSNTDYAYLYHNDSDDSYSDRAIGIKMDTFWMVDKSKTSDESPKEKAEELTGHSEVTNQFTDDIIGYRYEKADKVFTRTIDINDGEAKISGGAVLFKDNKKVAWSSIKEGDVLVEVAKDKYYFIATTSTKDAILTGYSKKSGNTYIETTAGTFATYDKTRYTNYFTKTLKLFNKMADKDLKEILDKKVRLTFDMSERVVKIALLEDEIDIKELNLGIFAGFTAMSSGKTTNNKIEIIQNGKKKAYNTSVTSVGFDPGELIIYTYDEKLSTNVIKSVKTVGSKSDLADKIRIEKFKTSDLQKHVKYFDEEDGLRITQILYHYKFGKYETADSFELVTLSIAEYMGLKDDFTESYAIIDSEDVIKEVFVSDRSEKSTTYYGIVNKIYKDKKSSKNHVVVKVVGTIKEIDYELEGAINFVEGDFIKFTSEKGEKLKFVEKYSVGVMGYYKDIEVIGENIDSKTKKVTSYMLSNEGIFDPIIWKLTTKEEIINLNAYDMFLLTVSKDEKGYHFTKADNIKKGNIKLQTGDMIAINEIDDTVIVYRGFEKKS